MNEERDLGVMEEKEKRKTRAGKPRKKNKKNAIGTKAVWATPAHENQN